MGDEQQRLVDALVARTGQPRAKVEEWVAGSLRLLEGSLTVYDVSRVAADFVRKHVKNAKPYLFRFARSWLESYLEERQRLTKVADGKRAVKETIPRQARSEDKASRRAFRKPPDTNRNRWQRGQSVLPILFDSYRQMEHPAKPWIAKELKGRD
ncbi:hypothetical protein [Effusibacillus dendaii]|uniref:Uncharacterized protein n=1 Tax=Effusibacillus dendaii TaxID=2743772 RepID=A0A7I8DE17_9BACL|nr:hypothetical protein [Effusibacillus dendaii]BCJ86760.1 hypothetical protein skT53_17450 [Effusibacillus dendaii]